MCFKLELEEPKVAKVLFLPLISWLLWPKQLKVIKRDRFGLPIGCHQALINHLIISCSILSKMGSSWDARIYFSF